jgi:hypothetical protein
MHVQVARYKCGAAGGGLKKGTFWVIPITYANGPSGAGVRSRLRAESGVPGWRPPFTVRTTRFWIMIGMSVKTTCKQASCTERQSIGHSNSPLRWYFSSGALVLILFLPSEYRKKIVVPKVSSGLIAAGTDICVRELSRKTFGQSYVPPTISVSYLTPRCI